MTIDHNIKDTKIWHYPDTLRRVIDYCLMMEQGEEPTITQLSKRWMVYKAQASRVVSISKRLVDEDVIKLDNGNTWGNTWGNTCGNTTLCNSNDSQGVGGNTWGNTCGNTWGNTSPSPLISPLKREDEKESSKEKEEDKIYPPIIPPSPLSNIRARKEKFIESISRYVGRYGKDMCNEFYLYWTEPNKSGTKMRFEMEKTWDIGRRLARWANNNKSYGNNRTDVTADDRAREAMAIVARLAAEDDRRAEQVSR